ncbi:MAG: hypothetical protein ACE5JD_02880 [Candidatus Methylomirabilia bacterium]
MVETITLGGQHVLLRHEDVDLGEVHLDPNNRRLQFIVKSLGHGLGEEGLERQLWSIEEVKQLKRSIEENGGLVERIIVSHYGTVLEGNCRLVCYRKLLQQAPETDTDAERWKRIPARVLPPDITERQIHILLGDLHIAGKNEWKSIDKAAHIYDMHEIFGFSYDFLAEHLRMPKAAIKQLKDAYTLMAERYLVQYPDPQNLSQFSCFLELFKRFKAPSEELKKQFVVWLGEGRIYDGSQVRDLADIVTNPEARRALEGEGYDAAIGILNGERPERTSPVFKAMDRLIEHLRRAPKHEIDALRGGDRAKISRVRELYGALRSFAGVAEVRLEE